MSKFPRNENEIIALAQTIAAGILANATIFPHPPVTAADLSTQIDGFQQLRDQITAAEAALKQKYIDKEANLLDMIQMMKGEIQYVEMIAKGDESILNKIGWSGRAFPTTLQPPGQCRALEIYNQGSGWVQLDWKEPIDGGKVAAYKVQRSEDGGGFTDVATAVQSDATLINQPTMKNLSYKVRAINKAGEGMDSNTISIVL
jgi:hypothetical protein